MCIRDRSGATLAICGTVNKSLQRHLENAGTITWTGTGNVNSNSHDFTNEAGATFVADGPLWDFISSSGAETVTEILNLGTIAHTTSTTTLEAVVHDSTATSVLDVQAGTLAIASPGSFRHLTGATLQGAGTFNPASISAFSGDVAPGCLLYTSDAADE